MGGCPPDFPGTTEKAPETMANRVKVAKTADIPPDESLAVNVPGDTVAIFNVDGRFYAVSNACPHAGGSLADGWVANGQVTCPWHGWTFPLEPDDANPDDGLFRYRVHVDGDDLYLELPD